MAEPVAEDAEQSESSAADPVPFDMPDPRPDDDFYLALVARDDDDFTMTLTGWTELEQTLVGSDTLGYWWKIGDGNPEPATYDVDISGGAGEQCRMVVVRISGIDLVDPIGAVGTPNTGDTDGVEIATAPAITAEEADSLILRIYSCTSSGFTGFGSGTEVAKITSPTGGVHGYAISRESSPGASTSTGTATADIDDNSFIQSWYANTIEILAAGGGGGGQIESPILLMDHFNGGVAR